MNNCCVFEAPTLDRVLPPVLALEFLFGLVGNSVVLWTFAFHVRTWRPSSVYLTHLAVADSVVLFCLPIRAEYYWRGKDWIHGDVLCRLLLFLVACNRLAAIFFLTAAAVDRYCRIVCPHSRVSRISLRKAQGVSCGLWVLIFAMTTHLLSKEHLFFHSNGTQCESFNICMGFDPTPTWHNILYLVQFFLPAAFITFSTIRIIRQLRSKMDNQGKIKRAVQFVLAMALVFIICFFPSTIARVAILVLKYQYDGCSYFRVANLVFYMSLCFTYFNSVLNPVIYYFSCPAFSRTFQKLFERLVGRRGPLEKLRPNKNQPPRQPNGQQEQQEPQQQ